MGIASNCPPVRPHIPLGQIADVRIASGPPMIKNERACWSAMSLWTSTRASATSAVYVQDAKKAVAASVTTPAGYYLEVDGAV